MASSFYIQQLASMKGQVTQTVGEMVTSGQVKAAAKKITSTAFKIAFIADPFLLPVVQAGLEQLKGLFQLIRNADLQD